MTGVLSDECDPLGISLFGSKPAHCTPSPWNGDTFVWDILRVECSIDGEERSSLGFYLMSVIHSASRSSDRSRRTARRHRGMVTLLFGIF